MKDRSLFGAALFASTALLSSSPMAQAPDRLWVKVGPCEEKGAELAAVGTALLADLAASGVGALVKAASDRLITPDRHELATVVPLESTFVRRPGGALEFWPRCIVLNVGEKPIFPSTGERLRAPPPILLNDVRASAAYPSSPVVILLMLVESEDKTAMAAEILEWKYERFTDPTPTAFRKKRKLTIDVKFLDLDATAKLTYAIQAEATNETLGFLKPNEKERLPWVAHPTKNPPTPEVKRYGPMNLEVKITEIAEPSAFAKLFGTSLAKQQEAIEQLVRDRVTQALDESAAAKAKGVLVDAASTAYTAYEAAYDAALVARKAVTDATTEDARQRARTTLGIKLAALKQKEVLAREALDRAGLPFSPLPAIDMV